MWEKWPNPSMSGSSNLDLNAALSDGMCELIRRRLQQTMNIWQQICTYGVLTENKVSILNFVTY